MTASASGTAVFVGSSSTIVLTMVAGSATANVMVTTPQAVTLSLTDSSSTGVDVSSTVTFQVASGAAVQYIIVTPSDGTVDAPISVTVQAIDQFDNIATSEERDVSLVAAKAAGEEQLLINIASGSGIVTLSNEKSERVPLSLLDTASTGLSVTSTAEAFFAPGTTVFLV